MNRKRLWFLYAIFLLLLACLPIIFRGNDPHSLQDSDTQLIISGLTHHPGFFTWWHHDWPLANHFYRPLSTLLFQMDWWLWPNSSQGWNLTNGFIVSLSLLAMGWLWRELSDSPLLSTAAISLFAVWLFNLGGTIQPTISLIALVVLVLGVVRHSKNIGKYLPAFLVWTWVASEAGGMTDLYFRTLMWIPGRTATLMTLFACVSLASFARYCRLSPLRDKKFRPSALDKPATKSAEAPTKASLPSIGWLIGSIIACACALVSYEQAAAVLPLILLTAGYFHYKNRKILWKSGWVFAGIFVAYLGVRWMVVPHGHSHYYGMQIRSFGITFYQIQKYFLFPVVAFQAVWPEFTGPLAVWLLAPPYLDTIHLLASISALWEGRRRWLICGFGWLGSALAYLPVSFFKDFSHYHYLPMAMRSFGVIGLAWVAIDLTVIAVSPPSVQAPQRLCPAPGWLPHR